MVAEADGFGHMPTPEPTKSADATPEPTPAVLVNADMEKGEYEPMAPRGSASISVVDDGANNTKKSAKVTGRTDDWHGASILLWLKQTMNMRFLFMQSRKQARLRNWIFPCSM